MRERGYYWTDAPNGEYEILFRPDGTEVTTITEPEDRISLRDLAPVCVELNTLQAENARLREQAAILQDGRCTSCMEPINPLNMKCQCVRNEFETLYFQLTECENEVSSIREQADALAEAALALFYARESTAKHVRNQLASAEAALRAYKEGRDE